MYDHIILLGKSSSKSYGGVEKVHECIIREFKLISKSSNVIHVDSIKSFLRILFSFWPKRFFKKPKIFLISSGFSSLCLPFLPSTKKVFLCHGFYNYYEVNNNNEFFLNIGNKLAIERIFESLTFSNLENIYIAVRNIDKKYLSLKPFRNLNFIVVGKTFGVLNSIENVLEKIADDNISIIPITTIPDEKNYEEKTCYFSKIPIPKENWSAIKIIKSSILFIL